MSLEAGILGNLIGPRVHLPLLGEAEERQLAWVWNGAERDCHRDDRSASRSRLASPTDDSS
jgi:hypothetical protein